MFLNVIFWSFLDFDLLFISLKTFLKCLKNALKINRFSEHLESTFQSYKVNDLLE